MSVDRIVEEFFKRCNIASRGKHLKGSHPYMACCNPSKHRAGQWLVAVDGFARADRCKRAGRGHPERIHGFADQIFTQDRSQPRAAITAARIGRGPGPFQLDVVTPFIGPVGFAQQHRPPIAQLWCVMTKLMAGIKLGQRHCPIDQLIAAEHLCQIGHRTAGNT